MNSSCEADWEPAAEDAGVSDPNVVLYPLRATGSHSAMHFPPGLTPHQWDDEFDYIDVDRDALRVLEGTHVIVVRGDLEGDDRRLVLRHEAEHVAQYEASQASATFAFRLAVGLPTTGWLYPAMPHERDADAAATRFARDNEIVAAEGDLKEEIRFLYAAPWGPPETESLPLRLLAFSLLYVEEFDLACTSSQYWPYADPEELIEAMVPGGVSARGALRGFLSGEIEAMTEHGITKEDWDQITREERCAFSDGLRARVLQCEEQAVEALRAELATPAG